jgi:RNA polymerase sigma factor (sigma-70 family)
MKTHTSTGAVLTPAPTDEELVLLAQQAGSSSQAILALFYRYEAAIHRLVALRVGDVHQHCIEAEDAAQEATLAVLQGVTCFHALSERSGDGLVRAFLLRIVRNRLATWARGLRRAERRLDRSKNAGQELEGRAAQVENELRPPRAGDPAAQIAWDDCRGRLEDALRCLSVEQRWLWDGLANGRRLRALAVEKGISYDRAKRERRRLLDLLREAVGVGTPSRTRRRRTNRQQLAAALESEAASQGDPRRPESCK